MFAVMVTIDGAIEAPPDGPYGAYLERIGVTGLDDLPGYLGGWVDDAVQYVYTVLTAIPCGDVAGGYSGCTSSCVAESNTSAMPLCPSNSALSRSRAEREARTSLSESPASRSLSAARVVANTIGMPRVSLSALSVRQTE